MTQNRRARPTIRCLVEDLGLELPALSVDLGAIEHPWLQELGRIAPTSPTGQKRILSIAHPVVYRLRVSTERGATWLEGDEVLWLCAVRRREDGSDDDAFEWFAQLHASGRLLPSDDDHLRDQAEEVLRLHRRLSSELLELTDRALATSGTECAADLDGWLPTRILVIRGVGVEEVWCAISVRASDGTFIRPELRDVLFASLEAHVAPAVFEARDDWPSGTLAWYEAVRLGLR
jgi:hypothetical protein